MSVDLFSQPKLLTEVKPVKKLEGFDWFTDYKARRDKIISDMYYGGGPIPGQLSDN